MEDASLMTARLSISGIEAEAGGRFSALVVYFYNM